MVLAHVTMLLCVVLWSTSGFLIALIDWNPMVIACLRSAIAMTFMFAVRGKEMFKYYMPSRSSLRLNLPPALIIGALFSAATRILYVNANAFTTPANAIVLQHSAPVWLLVFGFLVARERISILQRIAVCVVMFGTLLLFFDDIYMDFSLRAIFGNTLALASGLTFALTMLFLRRVKDGSPQFALLLAHIPPVLLGIPFIFISPPVFTLTSTVAIVILGIVQMGLASLLYGYSIKRLKAVNVMLISQLEPLLNGVWVFFFIGMLPSSLAVTGAVLIIISVTFAHLPKYAIEQAA